MEEAKLGNSLLVHKPGSPQMTSHLFTNILLSIITRGMNNPFSEKN